LPFPRTPVSSEPTAPRQGLRASPASTGRSRRNASPRWERASFSSASSSAMVRSASPRPKATRNSGS